MKAMGARMSTEENRISRSAEVKRLTGKSKATIHRRYRDGRFAKSVWPGSQSIGWWQVGILEWLESFRRAVAVLDDGRQNESARG